jgi:hypothetical protein
MLERRIPRMTVAAPTKFYRWIYGLMGVIGMACVLTILVLQMEN